MTVSRKLILPLVSVVVVGVLIVGAFLIFGHTSDKKPIVRAPGTSQAPRTGGSKSNNAPNSSSPADSPSPTAADSMAGDATRSAINGATTSSQLADTGPGSLITVFLVVTGLSAYAYRRLQVSRLR